MELAGWDKVICSRLSWDISWDVGVITGGVNTVSVGDCNWLSVNTVSLGDWKLQLAGWG